MRLRLLSSLGLDVFVVRDSGVLLRVGQPCHACGVYRPPSGWTLAFSCLVCVASAVLLRVGRWRSRIPARGVCCPPSGWTLASRIHCSWCGLVSLISFRLSDFVGRHLWLLLSSVSWDKVDDGLSLQVRWLSVRSGCALFHTPCPMRHAERGLRRDQHGAQHQRQRM